MIWTSIKAKLMLGVGLLVAGLLALLKIQSARLKRANERAREASELADLTIEVIKKSRKNEADHQSRRAQAKKEVEEGASSELENPNEW